MLVCDWFIKSKQILILFLTPVYWFLWQGRRRLRRGLERNESDASVCPAALLQDKLGWVQPFCQPALAHFSSEARDLAT